MTATLDGEIVAGDAVKTLHLKRALYGKVLSIGKKKYAIVEGRTQPGAPKQRFPVHVENLDRIPHSELCPEDQ